MGRKALPSVASSIDDHVMASLCLRRGPSTPTGHMAEELPEIADKAVRGFLALRSRQIRLHCGASAWLDGLLTRAIGQIDST